MPSNWQQNHPDQDNSTSHPTARRLKLALAVAALLLLGAIVILHLTGVLNPSRLH